MNSIIRFLRGGPSLKEISEECRYNTKNIPDSNVKSGNTIHTTDPETHVNLIVAARYEKVTLPAIYKLCDLHIDKVKNNGDDYPVSERCEGYHACILLQRRFNEHYKRLLEKGHREQEIPHIVF